VDYNTAFRAPTTKAVEWFVDELDEFDNIVVAMRRTLRHMPGEITLDHASSRRVFDMPYHCLPVGIGLHRAMRLAARRIIALLAKHNIRPDVIHAHKFSVEGLCAWYVARAIGIPLVVSLRGEVESKIFRFKPSHKQAYRQVAAYTRRIYFVSAWFADEFHRYAPGMEAKTRLLPNVVRNLAPRIDPEPAVRGLVTVLNLDTHRRKGMRWLLDAIAIAIMIEPAIHLDIIGGGSAKAVAAVKRMIAKRGLGSAVQLLGPMPNAQVLEHLRGYRAMVLPSVNETFGMVYVESLFAGVPILFTKGTGVDGYLDQFDVGIGVPPRDDKAISQAILKLWRESDTYRKSIADAGRGLFDVFDPNRSVAAYKDDIRQVIAEAR
jgi:glycosyltransferase involved in cell wall biosynthesis